MKNIQLNPERKLSTSPLANCPLLLDSNEIQIRLKELAQEIDQAYTGKTLKILPILRGSFMFAADLAKYLKTPAQFDFIELSSYEHTSSSGQVLIRKDLSEDIRGQHVLILEDIVDTGLTLDFLLAHLKTHQAHSLKICSLLFKAERLIKKVPLDFVGFNIPNYFVLGYGMDYQGFFRSLDHIVAWDQKVALPDYIKPLK